MKKFNLSAFILLLATFLFTGCTKQVIIQYDMYKFLPSFNRALEELKLNKYLLKDNKPQFYKNVRVAGNSYLTTRLEFNEKNQIKEFEFIARNSMNQSDADKILAVIDKTFPSKDLYNKSNIKNENGRGVIYILK